MPDILVRFLCVNWRRISILFWLGDNSEKSSHVVTEYKRIQTLAFADTSCFLFLRNEYKQTPQPQTNLCLAVTRKVTMQRCRNIHVRAFAVLGTLPQGAEEWSSEKKNPYRWRRWDPPSHCVDTTRYNRATTLSYSVLQPLLVCLPVSLLHLVPCETEVVPGSHN
jgi:hypothetical protein